MLNKVDSFEAHKVFSYNCYALVSAQHMVNILMYRLGKSAEISYMLSVQQKGKKTALCSSVARQYASYLPQHLLHLLSH